MSWESYKPLNADQTIETEHLRLRAGDSIFVLDDSTALDDYDNMIKYHIVSIDTETETATLWNYGAEQFETVPVQTIKNWRENNAPVEPALTINNFTANGTTKTRLDTVKAALQIEEPQPVGVKIHGSLTQTPMTIETLGPTEFGCLLQVALKQGTHGIEITEPWNADVSISAPNLERFIEKVRAELGEAFVEQTALDDDAAQELITILLRDYEAKAHARIGMTETVLFDDEDALREYVTAQLDREPADFSVIFHERENNNLVQHFNTE